MKILYVFNHPAFYKISFLNELGKHCDLTVMIERKKARDRNVMFYQTNTKYSFSLQYLSGINIGTENHLSLGIINHLKRHQYDFIIMNGYATFTEMLTINYLKRHQIPFILMINGGIINHQESKFKRRLKTKYISSATYYLSPTVTSNEYLVYYGAKKDHIIQYPYSSLSESQYFTSTASALEKETIKQEFMLDKDRKVIVSVAQFIERKNNLLFINLAEQFPHVTFVLVGEGPEKRKYLRIIAKKRLTNLIIKDFMPHSSLLRLLRGSDLLFAPSSKDIYGHTILEGLYNNIWVLASSHINAAREFKNNPNLHIFNENSEIAGKIAKLLGSTPLNNDVSLLDYSFEKAARTVFKRLEELKR
ncbi:MAG: glycosyltransferase [Erysipelotrichaceae bacterium]|jgi:glycosyltransferase involved in cell wall biosynthesis|nr:glycosyltransferase [Erysipelotrichaceae bacterium]